MNKHLKSAVRVLKNGGIVIFPTDTAFGIGCRIDEANTVQKLFELRKRPHEKAVPVLASSVQMVEDYVDEIPSEVRSLMKKHWPGGLTIVLKCKKEKVPNLVRGGGDTVGFRVPNHRTIREMIRQVGVPILAPSANFSGEKTPFKFSHLDPDLVRLVDFAMSGRCSIKKPSTVIDCSKKPFKILREGAVRLQINQLTK